MDVSDPNILCQFYWFIDSGLNSFIDNTGELIGIEINNELKIKIKVVCKTLAGIYGTGYTGTRYYYYYIAPKNQKTISEKQKKAYEEGVHAGEKNTMKKIEACVALPPSE